MFHGFERKRKVKTSMTFLPLKFLSKSAIFVTFNYRDNETGPWRVLPYLGMVGMFSVDDPHFWDFDPIGSQFHAPSRSDWPSLSAEKIGLSLSHLVSEIFGPKFGLIFQQNWLFNCFYAFCINFLIDFQSNLSPSSLILDLFDPSLYFRSKWVHFSFYPSHNKKKNGWSIPLPPQGGRTSL